MLDPADRAIIKEAVEAAHDALQSDEVSIVQDAHEDLTIVAQRIAESIYGGSARVKGATTSRLRGWRHRPGHRSR